MTTRPLIATAFLATAIGCGPTVSPTSTSTPPTANTAEDGKTNREYLAWAKYNPGTTITLNGSGTVDGKPARQSMTVKLLEVTDSKCTIEMETVETRDGKEEHSPASKMSVEKDKKEFLPISLDHATGKPVGVTEEGVLQRTIGGREFACRWYKFKQQPAPGREEEGELWVCDDFPGRVVKLSRKTKGTDVTLEATDVTIKK